MLDTVRNDEYFDLSTVDVGDETKSMSNMLNEVTFELQDRIDKDFQRILTKLEETSNHSRFRPPHNIEHFPCGFEDCTACELKKAGQAAAEQLRKELFALVEEHVRNNRRNEHAEEEKLE